MAEQQAGFWREFTVAADHPCLAGHFPGHPVVPAVMLLQFVGETLASALGRKLRVASVPLAKFTAPLLPQQAVRVALELDEPAKSARFRLTRDGIELAAGRVEYSWDGAVDG